MTLNTSSPSHRAHHPRPPPWKRRVFMLFLLTGAIVLQTAMTPDTPVRNFRLPMFSDEGKLLWNLRGQEGRYINENQVDVFGMELTLFSESEAERVEARIHSPSATVFVQRNEAEGSESLTMEGGHYVISGKNWRWEGDENRVSIDEDPEVLFYDDISDLFR